MSSTSTTWSRGRVQRSSAPRLVAGVQKRRGRESTLEFGRHKEINDFVTSEGTLVAEKLEDGARR